MTGPGVVSEVESAATESRDWDELAHYPTCGDGNWALCGVNLTGSTAGSDDDPLCVVCEELDAASEGCTCPLGCSCCTPSWAEPSWAIFDEIHYFTGGAA